MMGDLGANLLIFKMLFSLLFSKFPERN